MKRLVILSIILWALCKVTLSTPQARDVLLWEGKTYHIYPFIEIEKRFDNTQLEILNASAQNAVVSSNWRGYYYEFEIRCDTLFLVAIKDNHNESLMTQVLGSNDRIMINDYSDTLFLGYGNSFYDEQFPTMIYENEMTVVFDSGIVRYVEDHKHKSKQSELPQNVVLLENLIYSSIHWEALDKNILEENPQVVVGFSTDSLGKIRNPQILRSSGYPDCDTEAIRVVSILPDFSSSFVCGKYLDHSYRFRIEFDRSKQCDKRQVSLLSHIGGGAGLLFEKNSPASINHCTGGVGVELKVGLTDRWWLLVGLDYQIRYMETSPVILRGHILRLPVRIEYNLKWFYLATGPFFEKGFSNIPNQYNVGLAGVDLEIGGRINLNRRDHLRIGLLSSFGFSSEKSRLNLCEVNWLLRVGYEHNL